MRDNGDNDQNARQPNPVDIHVGGRVKWRRMLLGMSQEKLGDFLGLTFQQVQKYEQGKNRIGASRLHAISQILGVPIQFFYDDLGADAASGSGAPGFAEPPQEDFVSGFIRTREGLELNKAFVRISNPAARRAIIDLVRALAGEGTEGD